MEVLFAENGREGLDDAEGEPGRRPRPDGHHDAGDGRLRDHAGGSAACPSSSRCRSSRSTAKAMKGDREKCDRVGRVRLHHEAGRRGPAALADARLAVPVGDGDRRPGPRERRPRADRDPAAARGDLPALRLRLPRLRARRR